MSVIAKYKFDKSIYENLIPVFNDGYTGYTISDEIDSENNNHVTRTIECDSLPTYMRFGTDDTSDSYILTNREASLLGVENVNVNNITNMNNMFRHCQNVKYINFSGNTSNVVNMCRFITRCYNLETITGYENWDTSKVTDMSYAFNHDYKLTSLDLSNWNTSSVINMQWMFCGSTSLQTVLLGECTNDALITVEGIFSACTALTSIDLSGFRVPVLRTTRAMFNACTNIENIIIPNGFITNKNTNLEVMFYECKKLTQINTSNWDTSNVTNMKSTFAYCQKLTSLDVSNWDTNNVTNMFNTFQSCKLLTSLDVSNWNTGNVTTMGYMFRSCNNLTSIDVSGFDTSNVTNMSYMFANCYKLTSLDVSKFNTNKVTTMAYMFSGRDTDIMNITTLDVSNWDTSNVTDMSHMFYRCYKLTSLDVSNWDTSNVTDMTVLFDQCNNLTELDVSNWNTSNVTTMYGMFFYCEKLTSIDVSNWNVGNVTTMQYMFHNCISLTSLDVNNWNTSNVNNMNGMFHSCNKLTSLNLSNWDTNKVTNMTYMFYNCFLLTELDLSNFDTNKVTTMASMFRGCISLTSLGVSEFDTSNVTDINNMFRDCKALTALDISGFDTSNVADMQYMFCGCISLTSINVSNFDTRNVKNMAALFMDCKLLTSLDLSNFNTINVANMSYMFRDCNKLLNIGMIYSDFKTVEKVASVIPTINPTTIWVGNHIDINELTQYDHITYKVYKVEDKLEVELSSPLLEGDRLEIIDGDLYHYHKMKLIELDGSTDEIWYMVTDNSTGLQKGYSRFYNVNSTTDKKPGCSNLYSNYLPTSNSTFQINENYECIGGYPEDYSQVGARSYITVKLKKESMVTDEFRAWLEAKPIIVVYELANPYYELVKPNVGLLNAGQGLYLSISDSVVPINYQFDLCTTKLNYLLSNTQYKVSFKANEEGAISLNLGGALSPLDVTKGLNEVLITTPETLEHEYLKINGPSNIKISNVMVVDSEKDLDYFKGMNNNFDEKPVNNICSHRTLTYLHGTDEEGKSPQYELTKTINKGKLLTVVGKVNNNPNNSPISINLYNDIPNKSYGKNLWGWSGDEMHINTLYRTAKNYGRSYWLEEGIYKVTFNADKNDSNDPRIILVLEDGNFRQCYLNTENSIEINSKVVSIQLYSNGYNWAGSQDIYTNFSNIQIEKVNSKNDPATAYEPPEFNVNNDPIFINPNENGNFIFQIKADRDYANRIGFDVGNASTLTVNDTVQITDLMVFEGDFTDCYPTTWQDFDETRYLAEFISYNNEFGFGKNRLI